MFPEFMTWYKKPSYVDFNEFATALREKGEAGSNYSGSPRPSTESSRPTKKTDIPKKLSLERIMKNKTCSPMSLYDFYMYLKYIELSSENLEFYVWFKNYESGRLTAFPELPRAVTPVSIVDDSDSTTDITDAKPDGYMTELNGKDVEMNEAELYARIASFVQPGSGCGGNGACSLPQRSKRNSSKVSESEEMALPEPDKTSTEIRSLQAAELETIKNLFIVAGSPKELNLPAPMRKKALDAIDSGSTDAENLREVAEHCYLLLKSCSHRNFVRLGVGNGTFETLCVATTLGIVLTVMGFVAMLLLALVSPGFKEGSRWRGIGIWPMWATGLGLILSGLRGSCFFLLLFSRRQPLPWEVYDEESMSSPNKKRPAILAFFSKLMIFDRKMKVKDEDLRRLQYKVVAQSLLGGASFATIFVVIFLCLPIWKPL